MSTYKTYIIYTYRCTRKQSNRQPESQLLCFSPFRLAAHVKDYRHNLLKVWSDETSANIFLPKSARSQEQMFAATLQPSPHPQAPPSFSLDSGTVVGSLFLVERFAPSPPPPPPFSSYGNRIIIWYFFLCPFDLGGAVLARESHRFFCEEKSLVFCSKWEIWRCFFMHLVSKAWTFFFSFFSRVTVEVVLTLPPSSSSSSSFPAAVAAAVTNNNSNNRNSGRNSSNSSIFIFTPRVQSGVNTSLAAPEARKTRPRNTSHRSLPPSACGATTRVANCDSANDQALFAADEKCMQKTTTFLTKNRS